MATIEPPKLKHQPRTFFAEILRRRAKEEGGYLALSEAISRAYCTNVLDPSSLADTVIIDRRKLKDLSEDKRKLKLSIVELEALHAYLEQMEEGLTRRAFFKFSSLVQELAQSLDAAMILPSRLGHEGPVLSYWDWQAMAEIQRTVNLYSNAITFDLIDVQRSTQEPGPRFGRWQRLFGKSGPSSVICIGSPRSNRATERALKSMFRPKPRTPGRWNSLPFSFVFLSESGHGLPSLFSRPVDQFKGAHDKLVAAVRAGEGWGLIAGEESFLSEAAVKRNAPSGDKMLQKRIRSYGVIAAQRQGHRLIVAVAGLTGPGTLAAASRLSAMSGSLPQQGDVNENAVLWGVVETVVDTTRMMDGGVPALEAHRFVVEPSLWDPELRRPIAYDQASDPDSHARGAARSARRAARASA
ncbi:MAG: hypothetical protein ACYTKC_21550 [Planctomycetota bacterium]|jgi:hypothetical protein